MATPVLERAAVIAPLLTPSPATIMLVDPAGKVTFANHGLKGEPARDLLSRSVVDLVAGEHADRIRAALARALTEKASDSFELGEKGPGGPTAWWRVDASPVEGGGAAFVFCDIITTRKEVERLRRSETLLVDAQGVAHMGTWDWDVTQPIASWSEELYRIYGLTRETYVPSYEAYLTKVHPDDRARVMAVTEACFKEHKPYSHDERIFRSDGEMRWLHTWAVPVLDDHGKLLRLLGVCQDITEQKKAESAMRAQMMTRGLARRLLHDLIRRAHVSEHVVRDLGRGLAVERATGERSAQAYAEAFADMGFGSLRYAGTQGNRHEFTATDLLEHRAESPLPTCFLTLGYLEGAMAAIIGRPALGNEMRCQSMGHEECRFVVMAQ